MNTSSLSLVMLVTLFAGIFLSSCVHSSRELPQDFSSPNVNRQYESLEGMEESEDPVKEDSSTPEFDSRAFEQIYGGYLTNSEIRGGVLPTLDEKVVEAPTLAENPAEDAIQTPPVEVALPEEDNLTLLKYQAESERRFAEFRGRINELMVQNNRLRFERERAIRESKEARRTLEENTDARRAVELQAQLDEARAERDSARATLADQEKLRAENKSLRESLLAERSNRVSTEEVSRKDFQEGFTPPLSEGLATQTIAPITGMSDALIDRTIIGYAISFVGGYLILKTFYMLKDRISMRYADPNTLVPRRSPVAFIQMHTLGSDRGPRRNRRRIFFKRRSWWLWWLK